MQDLKTAIIGFASIFGGIILILTILKLRQVWKARNWPSTTGRVVRSEVESKASSSSGRDRGTIVGNYPLVVYDYVVAGRQYQARRVDLGEPAPNAEVGETLTRYPVGATVTVYYNPAKPDEAILEHLPIRRFAEGLGCLFVLLGGGAVGALFSFKHLFAWAARYLPNAQNTQFVVLVGAMGLAAALFAVFSLLRTLKERRWPKAPGRIISSRVESFRSLGSGNRSNSITLYRPAVVYEYVVGGRCYEGNQITNGAAVSASVTGPAERTVQRYPIGRVIDVRYNPENSAESLLETTASSFVLGLIIAAVLLGLAVATSGYFHHPK